MNAGLTNVELESRIRNELDGLRLIDPHTHIDPYAPASTSLADILGYHYYTELAHSAGMPRAEIEGESMDPRTRVQRLFGWLQPLNNTIQYRWLEEMLQEWFGWEPGRPLEPSDWEEAYESAERMLSQDDWEEQVLEHSKLDAVFLTNDFDDSLDGFDTSRYVPCLRTDDLVFHLSRSPVRERLESSSGIEVRDVPTLESAIAQRFDHFVSRGARACAISLPPNFEPRMVSAGRAASAWDEVAQRGIEAGESQLRALSQYVFWFLASQCRDRGLPFDLMIGVNRAVYAGGVFQGQDLFDSRVSLIQYRELFNAFPEVTFPISVLASVTNQELASYAWIFPNVVTHGHWWYSNTPPYIEADLAARLEAVPRTKQIGYYSDMYKLEFALPKFNMYRRCLARVLANCFVLGRGWSETAAVELGRELLRGNVERIFGNPVASA